MNERVKASRQIWFEHSDISNSTMRQSGIKEWLLNDHDLIEENSRVAEAREVVQESERKERKRKRDEERKDK